MNTKDYLIASLRFQREMLDDLVSRIEENENLDSQDLSAYEYMTRRVERGLRQLRRSSLDRFVRGGLWN